MLAPGASAGRDHAGLIAIEKALLGSGIEVRRIDFPYRLAGRAAPDRPDVLISTIRTAAEQLATESQLDPATIALGGRSMGGRIASMAVASGLPAACLVLVSYPLHPPGRPDKSRVEHFPEIDVPSLFVSGTRDAFGTPAEIESAVRPISGPVTIHLLEGGDHGLARREAAAADAVRTFLLEGLQR